MLLKEIFCPPGPVLQDLSSVLAKLRAQHQSCQFPAAHIQHATAPVSLQHLAAHGGQTPSTTSYLWSNKESADVRNPIKVLLVSKTQQQLTARLKC